MNRNALLAISLISSGLLTAVILWAGALSDRIGRRGVSLFLMAMA
ncbi:hypothetical protein [Nocardia sp. NPDC058480]